MKINKVNGMRIMLFDVDKLEGAMRDLAQASGINMIPDTDWYKPYLVEQSEVLLVNCRDSFEKWIVENGQSIERYTDSVYYSGEVRSMWKAWKACWELRSRKTEK